MEPKNEKKMEHENSVMLCPDCGGKKVSSSMQEHKFTYGVGDTAVELSASVPVRKCDECGFCFLDSEADDICHEVVCKHLGLMTPKQIKDLRELHKLSQSQFATLTGLGEATLSRWERGINIQNEAYDNYLYLLGFKVNIEWIQKRKGEEVSKQVSLEKIKESFPALAGKITEELIEKQNRFELQPH
jgi:putative zinc finger/helix-turn-helix YgiT family protein